MSLIEPRCKSDFAQHFINANGYVMPCCWLGSYPAFQEFLRLYQDCLEEMKIQNRKLSSILNDPRFLRIEESWSSDTPFKPCLEFCRKKEQNPSLQLMGRSNLKEIYNNIK